MCSLGGREVRRGREGRRECVKGWVVAGERKGERAERVEKVVVGGCQEVEREGRQEVRSQVRGGDNDKLCFSALSDRETERWRKRKEEQKGRIGNYFVHITDLTITCVFKSNTTIFETSDGTDEE